MEPVNTVAVGASSDTIAIAQAVDPTLVDIKTTLPGGRPMARLSSVPTRQRTWHWCNSTVPAGLNRPRLGDSASLVLGEGIVGVGNANGVGGRPVTQGGR